MPTRTVPRVTSCFWRLVARLDPHLLYVGRSGMGEPMFRVDLAVGHPSRFPAARDFAYTTDETRPIRVVVAPKLEGHVVERIEGDPASYHHRTLRDVIKQASVPDLQPS